MKKLMLGLIAMSLLLALPIWAEQWQELTPTVKPPARIGHAMVVLNNAIYVFGGQVAGRNGLVHDMWRFSEDSWVEELPVTDPPEARLAPAATVYNNKIYVFGGFTAFGEAKADMWSYVPGVKTWTQEPSFGDVPPGRYYHTVNTLPDGKIVLFGGINAQGNIADAYVRVYDPVTGVWTKKSIHPQGVPYGHCAVVIEGKLYVFGGFTTAYTNDTWVYDPAADTWTKITPQRAIPTFRMFAAIAQNDKSFWIFGGKFTADLNDNWEFNTTTNVWTQHANLPIPMQQAQAGMILKNNVVEHILFGGKSNDVIIDKTYQYTPEDTPPQPTEKMVHNQIGALEKGMCSFLYLRFDKTQAKAKVALEWNQANAKVKLQAWALHWNHCDNDDELAESLMMFMGIPEMNDTRDDGWDRSMKHRFGNALMADEQRGNKLEVNLTKVNLLLVLVRHSCRTAAAKELQLKVTEFKDDPKNAFYLFPVGTFDKTNPARLHFVHLPVAPTRWHSRFPHGTQGEEKTEALPKFWEWRFTDKTPRFRWFGYVKFALP